MVTQFQLGWGPADRRHTGPSRVPPRVWSALRSIHMLVGGRQHHPTICASELKLGFQGTLRKWPSLIIRVFYTAHITAHNGNVASWAANGHPWAAFFALLRHGCTKNCAVSTHTLDIAWVAGRHALCPRKYLAFVCGCGYGTTDGGCQHCRNQPTRHQRATVAAATDRFFNFHMFNYSIHSTPGLAGVPRDTHLRPSQKASGPRAKAASASPK